MQINNNILSLIYYEFNYKLKCMDEYKKELFFVGNTYNYYSIIRPLIMSDLES